MTISPNPFQVLNKLSGISRLIFVATLWLGMALATTSAYAQVDVYPLANQALQNGEFEKAAKYFAELYDQNPKDARYVNGYIQALSEIGSLKQAEKIARKTAKAAQGTPSDFEATLRLSNLLRRAKQGSEADKVLNELITRNSRSVDALIFLASEFDGANLPTQALATYRKAREVLKEPSAFAMEMAELQGRTGDISGMVDAYLDLLFAQPSSVEFVETQFTQRIVEPADLAKARTAILARIQKQPEATVFSELMIWLQLQQGDYEGAFIQAKALDRRSGGSPFGGQRVIKLARTTAELGMYYLAESMYAYLVEKGTSSSTYLEAKSEGLAVRKQRLTRKEPLPIDSLKLLSTEYQAFVQELGLTNQALPVLREAAKLRAYYLEEFPQAITQLTTAIETPGLSRLAVAECKLDLGDLHLASSEIWEPQLLYGQVDKDFKEEPIGREAKFRNAKVAFYTGEFEWAQAQLDVLKTATTQLISNDAINLSLLIQDNYGADSNLTPLTMYARADLLNFRKKPQDAVAVFDSLLFNFPGHPLTDEVLFAKAKIAEQRGMYTTAIQLYDSVASAFPDDILADDAIFGAGRIYYDVLKTEPNAQAEATKRFQKLIESYPGSTFTVEARKRFRLLRGDVL